MVWGRCRRDAPAPRCQWARAILIGVLCALNSAAQAPTSANTWVVIVNTSRFWYNYRHLANALIVYRTARRQGVSDANIVFMTPESYACNPRNPFPGVVRSPQDAGSNLYGADVEVDYCGADVTAANFFRLLTGCRWA